MNINKDSFTFTHNMIRAALIANGWTRLKSDNWQINGTDISMPRLLAFKTLLRDKNLG